MKKIFTLLFLFLYVGLLYAQKTNFLKGDESQQPLKDFAVLPDRGYSFQEIITNKNFLPQDSLIGAKAYWVKLVIAPIQFATNYRIKIAPNYHTKLYQYDISTHKWLTSSSTLANSYPRQLGQHSFTTNKQVSDTLFLFVDVNVQNSKDNRYKLDLKVSTEQAYTALQSRQQIVWLIGLAVIALFFLHNLYFYLTFRDPTVAYYLFIQVGGTIYLTSYWYKFDLWFSDTVFNYILVNNLRTYDINNLLAHVGIVIIMYGFVGFVRSYLSTKVNLPFLDKLLKYLLGIYLTFTIIIATINIFWIEIEHFTVIYDNIYCVVIFLTIAYTCVWGYLKKLPSSGALLFATVFQLVLIVAIPIYHLVISTDGQNNYWSILIAALSQALMYAIALVNRTKLIQQELQKKEIAHQQLSFDLREVAYKNQLRELEIAQMNTAMEAEKTKSGLLQDKLELSQRELMSSTLQTVQKNELLVQLKQQLLDIKHADRYHSLKGMATIDGLLADNLKLDADWLNFKKHFESVHPDFFEKLKTHQPLLTQKETRLYAYLHMQLNHKEIAALMGIDQASVRRAKTRLLKKIGKETGEDSE